jgi:hypothetical protein
MDRLQAHHVCVMTPGPEGRRRSRRCPTGVAGKGPFLHRAARPFRHPFRERGREGQRELPWVIPSHQAPALLLKLWRPRLFSGFALVLGTIAPDLEFIVRLDGAWFVSHTVLGQLYFTVPVVLLLYAVSVDLVIPWLLPYLPEGPPLHWHELAALRRPRGWEWWSVGASGMVGGLTHIFLDGFTHGDRSGWAVARWGILRSRVPVLDVPVFEALQGILTVALALISLWAWRHMVSEGLLRAWSGETRFRVPRASRRSQGELLRWLTGCVAAGVVLALGFRPLPSLGLAVERGAYGILTFLAFGILGAALAARIVRVPQARGAASVSGRLRKVAEGAG